jgi:hypothetical protein
VPGIQDRHARPKLESGGLIGARHPGADLFRDPGHHVVAFLQDAVDAELVRYFGLEQAGPFGDGSGNVGRHPLDRIDVGVEHVLPRQH